MARRDTGRSARALLRVPRRGLGLIKSRLPVPVRRRVNRAVRRWRRRHVIDVSVIVPVFDAMPYLTELLASLDRQGLDERHRELIFVNDGSTDSSTEVLRAYCAQRRHTVLIEQPNSGWPGGPRNRGLQVARGNWYFFADGDDYLADNALRDLLDFARAQRSDIVMPRVAPVGGRALHRPFTETEATISPVTAFRSFTPHKLIRASLVRRGDLTFPEGKVRLEDGIFFSRAFLLAKRISVLADRDLYFLRTRAARDNISYQPIDPAGYTSSVRRIAETVLELVPAGRRRNDLLRVLLRRKVLRFYTPPRFLNYGPARRQAWVGAHQALLRDVIPVEADAGLPARFAELCRWLRAGDVDAVVADLERRAAETV